MAKTTIYETDDAQIEETVTENEYLDRVNVLEAIGLSYLTEHENGGVLSTEVNESGGYSYRHL